MLGDVINEQMMHACDNCDVILVDFFISELNKIRAMINVKYILFSYAI